MNALELGKGYEAGEKPVSLKSEFILTLYEHLLDVQTNGRRAKSIIDRAVLDLYEEFSKKPQVPYTAGPLPYFAVPEGESGEGYRAGQ